MFAALFSSRLRRFVAFSILAPLLAGLLNRRAATLRRKHGPSAAADRIERLAGLIRPDRATRRRRTGLLARL